MPKNYYSKNKKYSKKKNVNILGIVVFIVVMITLCVGCYFGGYHMMKLLIK